MGSSVRRLGSIALAICALSACKKESGLLYVEISSSLLIPAEANTLVVRVTGPTTTEEKSYALGAAPRDVWPQVLPILGDSVEKPLTIAAELRLLKSGMPSVAVGYGEITTILPSSGEVKVGLAVARACTDDDQDGYGIGFGCANPDCDDTRNDVPFPTFCPSPISPPPSDGGPPPDPDGGPQPDPDGGALPKDADLPVDDAGTPPEDAGTPGQPDAAEPGLICELIGTTCPSDQVCFSGRCWYPCNSDTDCTRVNEACLEAFNICVCRVPCDPNNVDSCIFGGSCVDGCCS